MKLCVTKSRLSGTVAIPGSKSHTIRAIAIASLAKGTSLIRRPLLSSDTASAVACYRRLGAIIDTSDDDQWQIVGTAGLIADPGDQIDVGNSGTTLRLAISSAALGPKGSRIVLTGDEQICSRPVGPLLAAITDLGATAESTGNNGRAPVAVSGTLAGGTTSIECVTSQYLSSLLLACPLAENDTQIDVTLLNEPDYVQMTLDWLDSQAIRYENQDMKRFIVAGGQCYRPFDRSIPADFSSATFFLCAGAILEADITLTGLDFSDSQPDKAVAEYLKQMGADIEMVGESSVRVRRSDLRGVEIDMNRTPDALPAMAVVAAFAEGTTRLVNVAQARNKETDRIKCMARELGRLGVRVEELPDGLVIEGGAGNSKPAELHGYADHRIVMALTLAGMAMDGRTTIDTAEAMNVTFPKYAGLMTNLGAQIKLTD